MSKDEFHRQFTQACTTPGQARTIRELCAYLGIGKSTFYRWFQGSGAPHFPSARKAVIDQLQAFK
jgi:predicted DNA-binding transcriptional regulator AlpA